VSKFSYRLWRSGFVRRWHSNPDMAHTAQTNAQHMWGCAVLAKFLFPGRYDVLTACLLHDCGEVDIGDLSGPAKRENPDVARMVSKLESNKMTELGIDYIPCPEMKFVDMLEAYLWVHKHNPKLLSTDEWVEQARQLDTMAATLGVMSGYQEILGEMA
jgi:5'-deoxynucleotidase YfbR-like HD superfamily hydrolase